VYFVLLWFIYAGGYGNIAWGAAILSADFSPRRLLGWKSGVAVSTRYEGQWLKARPLFWVLSFYKLCAIIIAQAIRCGWLLHSWLLGKVY